MEYIHKRQRNTKRKQDMKMVSASDIFTMSNLFIEKHIKDFLADDSSENSYLRILSSPLFKPQSFTIGERQSSIITLDRTEADFDRWCESLIMDQLHRIAESEEITFTNLHEILPIIKTNVLYFLEFKIEGINIKNKIWNQEFVDILRNIISFSLFGDPNVNLKTHKRFNDLARKIIPGTIKKMEMEKLNIASILKVSIASGLSGLDLKGSPAASSIFSHPGIPMKEYLGKPLGTYMNIYYRKLIDKANSPTPIFHWNQFQGALTAKKGIINIVWFLDDYIESYFDMLFLQKLLNIYKNVNIVVIPKNGTFGNDTSWSDIENILYLDIFKPLGIYLKTERLSICKNGPRMGTVNLKKLSKEVISLIENSDFVVIKGCRSHELVQGGLKKPSFTMFVVSREMSERITGYDARKSPIVFLYLSPGEYAFYGLKSKNIRTKKFSDDRKIYVCNSTLGDHARRCNIRDPEELIQELETILKNKNEFGENYIPLLEEANGLAEKLLDITKKTYDKLCERYTGIRWKEPHDLDKKMWGFLLNFAKEKVKLRQLGDRDGKLTLLDVGTGSGRDIKYATKKLGMNVIGIDNSDGFINLLKDLEKRGDMPQGSFLKADMRNLSCFPDNYFDIVRHNASLLHLPIIGKRYMVDLALIESYRVLKNHGLIFIFVKEGSGLQFIDTGEGLGGRVFQLFTKKSIGELVKRSGFVILQISREIEYRNNMKIPWIGVIADKVRQRI